LFHFFRFAAESGNADYFLKNSFTVTAFGQKQSFHLNLKAVDYRLFG